MQKYRQSAIITDFLIITDISAAVCRHPTEKLMRSGVWGRVDSPIKQYFIDQKLINESNKDQFFILWIPLRQKSHYEIDDHCIFENRYDFDSIKEQLNIKDISEKVALI